MGAEISVVVPVYDIEPYVESCLTSIARQSFRDLQVIVVDDGSNDRGPAIAEQFAERDARFVVTRQANAGLGAARNAGVRAADGDFLLFVDGDDVLPSNAVALLHASLTASGSDMASGVVRSFGAQETAAAKLTPFRQTVRGTHVSQMPGDLLLDRIVTNKLWRRSFWNAQRFAFPEGVLYEDIIVGLGGHVAARAVDVLHDTVYWWRRRGAGSVSITQNRAIVRGLEDRMTAVRHVAEQMTRHGMDDLRQQYEETVLGIDLRFFIDAADRGDAAYRESLVRHVREYLRDVKPACLEHLPAIERLKYHLLQRGMVDEMLEALAFQRQAIDRSRTLHRGGDVYGDYPFRTDRTKGVPASVYRLDAELQVRCRISQLAWADKRLTISGHAYIDRISVPRPGTGTIRLFARDHRTGQETPIPVTRHLDAEADQLAAQEQHTYVGAGFTAEFNPGPLLGEAVEDAMFSIVAEVEVGGITRRSDGWSGPAVGGLMTTRRRLRRDWDLRARLVDRQLKIDAEQAAVVVDDVECVGGDLVLKGSLPSDARRPVLIARRRIGGTVQRHRATLGGRHGQRRTFEVVIPVENLAAGLDMEDEPGRVELHEAGVAWQLRLTAQDLPQLPLVVRSPVTAIGVVAHGHELAPRVTAGGHLALVARLPQVTVTSLSWQGGPTLRLCGSQAGPRQQLDLVLRRRRSGREHRMARAVDAGSLAIDLPLAKLPGLPFDKPLEDGSWQVHVSAADGENLTGVKATPSLLRTLPTVCEHAGRRYTVHEGARESILIDAEPTSRLSSYDQYRMRRRAVSRAAVSRMKDVVVFVSWGGRHAGGDPRAIYDQLRREGGPPAVWIGSGGQAVFPAADVVESGTREHAEILTRARWIVTDDLLPSWWHPRRRQRVLQTWHGTPVKGNGFALPPDLAAAAPLWLRELRRQADAWDLVLSASVASTAVLRQTLQFRGEVVEAGAPRCDVIYRPGDCEERAAALRASMGIPPGGSVVLWAPTARDEGWTGRRKRGLEAAFPLTDPPKGTTFLVHGHPTLTEATRAGTPWRDVSTAADVHDLLLLADVLVTDYSSLCLDFLHTGRPVVLYMPDLDAFVERGSGFAVDVLASPPGLATRSADDAGEAARDAGAHGGADAGYAALLRRYGGPQDGLAATRALARLMAS